MLPSLPPITSATEAVKHPFSQQKLPVQPRFLHQMHPINRLIRINRTIVNAGRGLATNVDHHPMLCLERAIGERFGVDRTLWETGAFDAQVYPDLPFASSWAELLEKLLGSGSSGNPQSSTTAAGVVAAPAAAADGSSTSGNNSTRHALTVRTIGAQCHSRAKLLSKMQLACKPSSEGGGDANALLFVSGSHPARSLPFTDSFLQSSFSMLLYAHAMREKGDLPASLALWAVENPVNPPERLLKKVEAGAQVILTQPPFIQSSAEQWFANAEKNGVSSEVKILAGIPMSTSRGNLEFWLRLCGLAGTPEAVAVVASFPDSSSGDKEEYQRLVRDWNVKFVQWVSLK
jgi:hypothetical protein